MELLWIVIGLALIVMGADALVDGSSSVARRLKVSEFVIGLTIVGMGTSAPEMVVSLIGAIKGNSDVSLGNVLGSNIFNTLLILGLTAIILPIGITASNKKRDIPVNILVTVLLIVLGMRGNKLSMGDGIAFLVLFCGYIWWSFRSQSREDWQARKEEKEIPLWRAVIMIVLGLAGLVVGGRLFVDNATVLAQKLGVSDKFIAITLLAGGTSLPELATCVVAAAKKKGALALGNIIGSNLFNILLILGGSAIIYPLSFADIDFVDMGMLVFSAVALWASYFVGKKDTVDRLDGSLMVAGWVAYMTYLIINL